MYINANLTALEKNKGNNLKPSMEKNWLQFYPTGVDTLTCPKRTLYEYFLHNNKNYPNEVLIEYFGSKFKTKNLIQKVETAKKGFNSLGLKSGDSVSIAMLTTPEFVISCLALNALGIRVDIIDFVSEIDATREQMKNCHNTTLILMEELYDKLADFIDEKKFTKIITTSLFDSMIFPLNIIQKNKALKKSKAENKKTIADDKRITFANFMNNSEDLKYVPNVPYEENKSAFVVYSSGSASGIPTAYVITNDGINSTIFDHEIADMKFKRGQKYLNVLPAIYSTTITSSLFLPLVLGVKVVLDPRFDKNLFPKQIKSSKANHYIVNASHNESLITNDVDLNNLIYPIVGGEAIDITSEIKFNLKLMEQFNKKQKSFKYKLIKTAKHVISKEEPIEEPIKLGKGYGASQFGACVTVTNERCNKLGSVGIPLAHVTVGIFDPDTNEELGYNQIGEIRVISPSSIKSVFNDKEGKNRIFKFNQKDGKVWGHSGDIGYLDEDGCLFVKGRMDDSYLKDGVRKYPFQIEGVLKKLEFIEKCKVLRIDELGSGNVAFVTLKEGVQKQLSQIIAEIFESCLKSSENIEIDAIRLCSNFPIASSGKINTVLLRKQTDMLIFYEDGCIVINDFNDASLIKIPLNFPSIEEDLTKILTKENNFKSSQEYTVGG